MLFNKKARKKFWAVAVSETLDGIYPIVRIMHGEYVSRYQANKWLGIRLDRMVFNNGEVYKFFKVFDREVLADEVFKTMVDWSKVK